MPAPMARKGQYARGPQRMNALSGVRAGTGPAPTGWHRACPYIATNHILLLTRKVLKEETQ